MTITERPLPSACTRGHRLAWHADGRGFDVLEGGRLLTVVKYPRTQDWRRVTFCPWCGCAVMVEQ